MAEQEIIKVKAHHAHKPERRSRKRSREPSSPLKRIFDSDEFFLTDVNDNNNNVNKRRRNSGDRDSDSDKSSLSRLSIAYPSYHRNNINDNNNNNEYLNNINKEKMKETQSFDWEIPVDEIKLKRRLGRGGFGEVYKGNNNDAFSLSLLSLTHTFSLSSLTYLLSHSLNYSHILSLFLSYLLTHSLTYSHILSLSLSLTYLLTHTFTHLLTHSSLSLSHLLTLSSLSVSASWRGTDVAVKKLFISTQKNWKTKLRNEIGVLCKVIIIIIINYYYLLLLFIIISVKTSKHCVIHGSSLTWCE